MKFRLKFLLFIILFFLPLTLIPSLLKKPNYEFPECVNKLLSDLKENKKICESRIYKENGYCDDMDFCLGGNYCSYDTKRAFLEFCVQDCEKMKKENEEKVAKAKIAKEAKAEKAAVKAAKTKVANEAKKAKAEAAEAAKKAKAEAAKKAKVTEQTRRLEDPENKIQLDCNIAFEKLNKDNREIFYTYVWIFYTWVFLLFYLIIYRA